MVRAPVHDFGLAVLQNADGQLNVLPTPVKVFDEFLRLAVQFHKRGSFLQGLTVRLHCTQKKQPRKGAAFHLVFRDLFTYELVVSDRCTTSDLQLYF